MVLGKGMNTTFHQPGSSRLGFRASKLVSLLAGVLLSNTASVQANPSHQPLGPDFRVDSGFTGYQGVSAHSNAICFDAAGNSVVVFGSTQFDPSGDPFFQRYDAAGDPVGSAVHVNPTINQLEDAPSIAMAPNGDFVVVWQANGPDGDNFGIFARVFDGDGTPKGGEFQVNQVIAGSQGRPSAAMDALGNIAISWGTSYGDPSIDPPVSLRTFYDGVVELRAERDGGERFLWDRPYERFLLTN